MSCCGNGTEDKIHNVGHQIARKKPMNYNFFQRNKKINKAIGKTLHEFVYREVTDSRLVDVLLQRIRTSAFLKGLLSYHLHRGLGGTFTETEIIEFGAALELFFSHTAYLDNVIDHHEVRNDTTTYLREHGTNTHILAAGWALHYGGKLLLPMLIHWNKNLSDLYEYDRVFLAVTRESQPVDSVSDVMNLLNDIYGRFTSTALSMAATSATDNYMKIDAIAKCGKNLGIGIAIAEELKDHFGEHGRRRAFELEHGRMGLMLHHLCSANVDFPIKEYIGCTLSDADYSGLLYESFVSGAVEQTIADMNRFLDAADHSLHGAVTEACLDEFHSLTCNIKETISFVIEKNKSTIFGQEKRPDQGV